MTEDDKICFRYGTNTYNPETGLRGGSWECQPLSHYRKYIVGKVQGDPFGLSTRGIVPFVLSRNRTTFDELYARLAPSTGRGTPPPAAQPRDNSGQVDGQKMVSSCSYALAHAEVNRFTMTVVGGLYFWGGRRPGTLKCAEVDYGRAFELFRKAGDPKLFKDMTNILKQHAAKGEAAAVAALKTIDLTPLVR